MLHAITALGLAVFALAAGPAAAQDGPRLTAPQIEAAFVGKTLRGRHDKITLGDPGNPTGHRRRTDGGHIVLEFVIRPDRSLVFRCTNHDRTGKAAPCTGTGSASSGRDAGIWSIEHDRICYQWLKARGGHKQCYDVFRAGDRFRWRLASGPLATLDGEIVEARCSRLPSRTAC
jgi:hypothetical protein